VHWSGISFRHFQQGRRIRQVLIKKIFPGLSRPGERSITFSSLAATALASIAGALLAATNRSVLTGGVMVALALIPSATDTGMGIVAGEWTVAGRALLCWVIEAGLVFIFPIAFFAWKQRRVQRRKMML